MRDDTPAGAGRRAGATRTTQGGNQLKTLHFTGSGTGATFGQAWQPGLTWPGLTCSTLTRQVDDENAALRQGFVRIRDLWTSRMVR